MSPLLALIFALLLTLVIEVPIGSLIIKTKSAVIPLILINILTNPALNALLMILFALTESYTAYWITMVIGEIAVFVGEGFLIRSLCDIPLKRSMIISIVINAASFLLGSAIIYGGFLCIQILT